MLVQGSVLLAGCLLVPVWLRDLSECFACQMSLERLDLRASDCTCKRSFSCLKFKKCREIFSGGLDKIYEVIEFFLFFIVAYKYVNKTWRTLQVCSKVLVFGLDGLLLLDCTLLLQLLCSHREAAQIASSRGN